MTEATRPGERPAGGSAELLTGKLSQTMSRDGSVSAAGGGGQTCPPTEYADSLQGAQEEPPEPPTRYPDEDASQAISRMRRADKLKRYAVLASGLVILLLIARFGVNTPDGEADRWIKTDQYVLEVAPGTEQSAEGPFVVYRSRNVTLAVYALPSGARWWSHEKAVSVVEEQAQRHFARLASLDLRCDRTRWFENTGIAVHRDNEMAVPYCKAQGTVAGIMVLAHVYLSADVMLAAVSWGESPADTSRLETVLSRLSVRELKHDGIDRRKRWPSARAHQMQSIREEAQTWHALREKAAGNAYRAYTRYMQLYQTTVYHPEALPASWNRAELWREISASAAYLEEKFRKIRNAVVAARESGSTEDLKRWVAELHMEIPDVEDHRWIWAQSELARVERGSADGGRRIGQGVL